MYPIRKTISFSLARFFALLLSAAVFFTTAHALTLSSVQSRKVHGSDGAQDLAINSNVTVSGKVTIEPRAIGIGHVIVFRFDQAVTLGPGHTFSLTGESGLSLIGQPGVGISVALVPGAANEVAATLTGIGDNRRVTVGLNDIVGADLSALNVRASVGFLLGDTNSSGAVDSTDTTSVRARAGSSAAQGGKEYDLNATGVISAADIAAVKASNGRTLVPGNTAPVVNAGGNQTVSFPATVTLNGTVTDDGFPNPPALTLTWSSEAGPAAAVFANAQAAQTTATLPQAGTYTLRLTASDGQLSSSADAIITAGASVTPDISGLAAGTTAGASQSLTVAMRDALNNVATGYTGSVHFTSNDPQAILPPDYTFVGGDAGVKVFNGVQLRTAGSRTITVSDVASSNASSANTTVSPGAAAVLVFVQQPPDGNVRTALSPAIQVGINDLFGNRTSDTTVVAVALANNPGGASLSGTTSRSAVAGVATFNDLALNNEGSGFTLSATLNPLLPVTSNGFSITDNIAPGAINDFSVNTLSEFSLDLSWTATGDDGFLGVAASYTLKGHTAPITAMNFASVGLEIPIGVPQSPGTPEFVTLNSLSANTLYYFALRVADGAGNTSFAFASGSTSPCPTGYTDPTCSTCANGYTNSGGVCVPICLASNPCTMPPSSSCSSPTLLASFTNPGTCSPDANTPYYTCGYSPQSTDCSATGLVCNTTGGVAACRTP